MTLIVSLINRTQAIQVVDQRLTSGGAVRAHHSNKATVLECLNGRFSIAYTGLASSGSFRMQRWIVDSVYDCGPPDFGIYEITNRLLRKADFDFANHPDIKRLNPANRRVTIMFTGYLYKDSALPANIMMTNFQDWHSGQDLPTAKDEFWSLDELAKEGAPNPTLIQRAGAWKSITDSELDELRGMLESERPCQGIQDKVAAVMRRAADRPAAAGSVGKDLMSVVIPADPNERPVPTFLPGNEANRVVLADYVRAVPGQSIAIANVEVTGGGAGPDALFVKPKPGRNDPCWCGSKKRYRRCHGK
jgi:SEC-C motif